jgi:hypothetical protein
MMQTAIISAMSVEQILAALIQERERLNRAIAVLSGEPAPAHVETTNGGGSGISGSAPKKKRHMSAAARKKIAEAQKRRWAAKGEAK